MNSDPSLNPRDPTRSSTAPGPIVYLTAGAGGMYCGSCMHDNTLARALQRAGADCLLAPTYTPIRTDEDSAAIEHVFLGGINVYLEQRLPGFGWAPGFLRHWLDHPALLRWATSRISSADNRLLGALTVSLLQGDHGRQKRELAELVAWLGRVRPRLVVFTNALIGGGIPGLKRALGVPVLVTLQGDDVFLESLPQRDRQRAIGLIGDLAEHVDAFLVHSDFYRRYMADYLRLPLEKFELVPLGLDLSGFPAPGEGSRSVPAWTPGQPATIGYLARLAPEKGLHHLVEAFQILRSNAAFCQVRLRIAGWLSDSQRPFAEAQFAKLRNAGLADACEYAGQPDRPGKIAFLHDLDLFSVPTDFLEPKGLYVLEAQAAGVPVVQPAHGVFPELLARTRGGELCPPRDPAALAAAWADLLADPNRRAALRRAGQESIHRDFTADTMARQTLAVFQRYARY